MYVKHVMCTSLLPALFLAPQPSLNFQLLIKAGIKNILPHLAVSCFILRSSHAQSENALKRVHGITSNVSLTTSIWNYFMLTFLSFKMSNNFEGQLQFLSLFLNEGSSVFAKLYHQCLCPQTELNVGLNTAALGLQGLLPVLLSHRILRDSMTGCTSKWTMHKKWIIQLYNTCSQQPQVSSPLNIALKSISRLLNSVWVV